MCTLKVGISLYLFFSKQELLELISYCIFKTRVSRNKQANINEIFSFSLTQTHNSYLNNPFSVFFLFLSYIISWGFPLHHCPQAGAEKVSYEISLHNFHGKICKTFKEKIMGKVMELQTFSLSKVFTTKINPNSGNT